MSEFNRPEDKTDYRPRRNREPFDATVEAQGMMDYVKDCFKKYADFKGRSRRSEYWYFYLFNIIISFALIIPAIALMVAKSDAFWLPVILLILYSLATILPTLAVVVRRLHDTSRSGWYYFMTLIPLVGIFILIVFLVDDSKPGTNQWGPNPKGEGNEDFDTEAFL
ncbi:DUF805 domain-containing protein [Nonlabens antarcticus]|uniref:DUF805 domain-containing protein n=1 Tax=Nonlabens antarcticus TaxID=392714 RepID=UPI001E482535|nr:DUF805 domain-containing protein [Nonlabens antarcticus]